MDQIMQYLPFLIPLFIIQLILQIIAFIHVLKHSKFKYGNKTIWIIIILLGQWLGPILYLTIGKSENDEDFED